MAGVERIESLTGQSTSTTAPAAFKFTGASAIAVAALGTVVLIGWAFDIEVLRSIIPGQIVMLPVTAAAFVAAGLSLWLQRQATMSALPLHSARILGALVLLIGLFSLAERLLGISTGLNVLFFYDDLRTYPYRPLGVMASNSAICFMLAGSGVLFLGAPRVDARWRELVALAGAAISSLALLGYFYGARSLYTFDRAAAMAFSTALGFEAFNLGLLLARPQIGGVALVTGRDMSSRVVRRLLLSTFIVPILSGWLWLRLREHSMISREGEISLFTIVTIAVLVTLVLQAGLVLRRTDAARERMLLRAQYARAEAEAANRVKSEFLATMSHELRTPLTAILGYTSLMLERISGELSSQQVINLGRIELSARHLLSLIDQILTVSRAEAGKETLNVTTVDVTTLVGETAAIAEPIVADRGLEFEVRNETDGLLRTDPDKARQVLLNLLANAAKFTEKGSVLLRIYRDASSARFCFEVTDTGIGIAPEYQERVFDAFWQIDMNTTRRYGGAGLGLSVSRRLAELLGGELTLSSTPGIGSTFKFSLPAEPVLSDVSAQTATA